MHLGSWPAALRTAGLPKLLTGCGYLATASQSAPENKYTLEARIHTSDAVFHHLVPSNPAEVRYAHLATSANGGIIP